MDYMENGNLRDFLVKEYTNLNWENKIKILLDIINGLKKIHEQNIIHRNLHSGNILKDLNNKSYIADLGLSFSTDQTLMPNNIIEKRAYIAPELKKTPYTLASD